MRAAHLDAWPLDSHDDLLLESVGEREGTLKASRPGEPTGPACVPTMAWMSVTHP